MASYYAPGFRVPNYRKGGSCGGGCGCGGSGLGGCGGSCGGKNSSEGVKGNAGHSFGLIETDYNRTMFDWVRGRAAFREASGNSLSRRLTSNAVQSTFRHAQRRPHGAANFEPLAVRVSASRANNNHCDKRTRRVEVGATVLDSHWGRDSEFDAGARDARLAAGPAAARLARLHPIRGHCCFCQLGPRLSPDGPGAVRDGGPGPERTAVVRTHAEGICSFGIDPRECRESDYATGQEKRCGPDVTGQFVGAIASLLGPIPISLDECLRLTMPGGLLDFKRAATKDCPKNCPKTVTLCDACHDSGTPGNIAFGMCGSATIGRGMVGLFGNVDELRGTGRMDPAWDIAAYNLGQALLGLRGTGLSGVLLSLYICGMVNTYVAWGSLPTAECPVC